MAGLVPIKWAASLKMVESAVVIIVRLIDKCTNKKVNKNKPINDIQIFLPTDDNESKLLIINYLLDIKIVNFQYFMCPSKV